VRQDLLKTAIEERKRLAMWLDLTPTDTARLDRFLKVFANATSYGISAKLNRRELPQRQDGEGQSPRSRWPIRDADCGT
jgi:hypothetical protein